MVKDFEVEVRTSQFVSLSGFYPTDLHVKEIPTCCKMKILCSNMPLQESKTANSDPYNFHMMAT